MLREQKRQAYYTQAPDQVLEYLKTSDQGLSASESSERLREYGYNELNEADKCPLFLRFLYQFKDLMVVILLIAAILAIITEGQKGLADALIILVVVVLNAAFGIYQEDQAESAIEALKSTSSSISHVRRNGHVIEVDSKSLVPGDIILLEAGDVVPADVRLLSANSLRIDESILTGESLPVNKDCSVSFPVDVPLGDRINMAYQNSNVTYGRGEGVVTNTGMFTEIGRVANMLQSLDETDTPLKKNLDQLSKFLTYVILAISTITFVVGIFLQGQDLLKGLTTSIALAVAAIPEGLPAIVTVVLSMGTKVLAKRNSIIRNLPAVETLGSTEIIASDKTGTLTLNQMTVEKVYTNGQLLAASEQIGVHNNILRVMSLVNNTKIHPSGTLNGDPTETALVQFSLAKNFDVRKTLSAEKRIAELPFDSTRKIMSTIHEQLNGTFFVAVKGAPDQLIKRITQIECHGKTRVITDSDKSMILSVNKNLAQQSLRVLMMAYKYVDSVPELKSDVVEGNLVFSGLVGMIDAERPEVAEAVYIAKRAGIRSIMITGDHPDTAEAIANRLGIIEEDHTKNGVLTGSELNKMSDEEFQRVFTKYSVYARMSPEHKVRIVKAWQQEGKVVAMTGDGVNDAPSLKIADIGIGMGIAGTEVSKRSADMVLADDNFATIIIAIEEGRKVFSNIQKTIQYLLSANTAEVLIIFISTLFGWDVLEPVHLLWINLVTDTLPAIALGVEPVEPGVMYCKPRGRNSSFFSGGIMSSIIYQGILQAILVLGVYGYALLCPEHSTYELIHDDALTLAYVTLGLIQLFHTFNVKSVYQSIFTVGFFRNTLFNWSIVGAFCLLMATVILPGFSQFFHVTVLTPTQWLVVLVGSSSMVVIVEIVKFIQRKFGFDKKTS